MVDFGEVIDKSGMTNRGVGQSLPDETAESGTYIMDCFNCVFISAVRD